MSEVTSDDVTDRDREDYGLIVAFIDWMNTGNAAHESDSFYIERDSAAEFMDDLKMTRMTNRELRIELKNARRHIKHLQLMLDFHDCPNCGAKLLKAGAIPYISNNDFGYCCHNYQCRAQFTLDDDANLVYLRTLPERPPMTEEEKAKRSEILAERASNFAKQMSDKSHVWDTSRTQYPIPCLQCGCLTSSLLSYQECQNQNNVFYGIQYVTELPDCVDSSYIYFLQFEKSGKSYSWAVAFKCPCGCGDIIQLPLLPDDKPSGGPRSPARIRPK